MIVVRVGQPWLTVMGLCCFFPSSNVQTIQTVALTGFEPSDVRRGQGEVASIRQMIECCVRDHGIDSSRIFVTGLSAGGAMASAMLACYPEVFAGGAIIAGLPFGAAANVHGWPSKRCPRGSSPVGARNGVLLVRRGFAAHSWAVAAHFCLAWWLRHHSGAGQCARNPQAVAGCSPGCGRPNARR